VASVTDHAVQGIDGLLGLALLKIADDGVHQHHPEDHGAIDPLVEKGGHPAGGQQDIDQGLVELEEEALPFAEAFARGHLVRTEAMEARFRLGLAQSRGSGGFEQTGGLFSWSLVPLDLVESCHGLSFVRRSHDFGRPSAGFGVQNRESCFENRVGVE
jgi:hypothetical protein